MNAHLGGCGCGCQSLAGTGLRYWNPSMDVQNHQEAHGAPKLSGQLPSHHLGAANALNYARYLNRPQRFENTGNESFEGGHLGNALNYARYLNRPQRFEATGNNAMELSHLGRVPRRGLMGFGAAALPYTAAANLAAPTYLFYLDTANFTGNTSAPYQYVSVPTATYAGVATIPIPNAPPDAVTVSGGTQVQWFGSVDRFGNWNKLGGAYLNAPTVLASEAMQLASALGTTINVGMVIQSTPIGTFLNELVKAVAPAAAMPTPGAAQVSQSGASSSNVAPIIVEPNQSIDAPAAQVLAAPIASTTVAPATVTIVSDAPTQIPVDTSATDVNPNTVTTGLQFTTLDYLLMAALAAVLILE